MPTNQATRLYVEQETLLRIHSKVAKQDVLEKDMKNLRSFFVNNYRSIITITNNCNTVRNSCQRHSFLLFRVQTVVLLRSVIILYSRQSNLVLLNRGRKRKNAVLESAVSVFSRTVFKVLLQPKKKYREKKGFIIYSTLVLK